MGFVLRLDALNTIDQMSLNTPVCLIISVNPIINVYGQLIYIQKFFNSTATYCSSFMFFWHHLAIQFINIVHSNNWVNSI